MSYKGLEIVINKNLPDFLPKKGLALGNVDVSEEFRANFNQWSMDRFGAERVFYIFGEKAYCSAENYFHTLRSRIKSNEY